MLPSLLFVRNYYQFSFELLHSRFRMWLWFRISTKNICGSTDLIGKKHIRSWSSIMSPLTVRNCSFRTCEITVHNFVFTLEGHRYPIINSGDTVALRSAYTSGSSSKYWLNCHKTHCDWHTCQDSTIMTSSGWTSCSSLIKFTITAKGKTDGQPINSGDTVSFRSNNYGSSYRLYCNASSETQCTIQS